MMIEGGQCDEEVEKVEVYIYRFFFYGLVSGLMGLCCWCLFRLFEDS